MSPPPPPKKPTKCLARKARYAAASAAAASASAAGGTTVALPQPTRTRNSRPKSSRRMPQARTRFDLMPQSEVFARFIAADCSFIHAPLSQDERLSQSLKTLQVKDALRDFEAARDIDPELDCLHAVSYMPMALGLFCIPYRTMTFPYDPPLSSLQIQQSRPGVIRVSHHKTRKVLLFADCRLPQGREQLLRFIADWGERHQYKLDSHSSRTPRPA